MNARLAAACLLLSCFVFVLPAVAEGRVFDCATTADVHAALSAAAPGDTIRLEGGRTYETGETFQLSAAGREDARIHFTSHDPAGEGRFAVITTVDRRKEQDLVAIRVSGSFWTVSRIEIAGKTVPLEDGFWDINGFRIGLYLTGPGSHDNLVEDVVIHRTHNTAVAVRDRAHRIEFRRINIHHVGEWLYDGYNAHEGEGFYLGSSKGVDERGYNARAHDILIEDSTLGPGLLGQFVDIKYGVSAVTVRKNVFHCGEKSYNEEIIKVAGFGNRVKGNRFVGAHPQLTRYIHIFNKKTDDPILVTYRGQTGIPAPTGRDNTVVNNLFQTDRLDIEMVDIDVRAEDRPTIRSEGNRTEPMNGQWPDKGKST